MRNIKFIAKVLGRNQWVYGQYFVTPLTDENSGEPPEAGWSFLSGPYAKPHHCIVQNSVAFTIDINTLGQYIGLEDKNGKEMYYGDLCEIEYFDDGKKEKMIIRWDDEKAGFYFVDILGDGWTITQTPVEVIGNIYDK
jgi:uncharacterized phage protein (TIGR01671 family)